MDAMNIFGLEEKTALVTGCKRGLGRAMAVALAEAGADVVGASVTLEQEGSDVGSEIESLGRSFRPYACDFADRDALYAFTERLRRDVPVIDILVNNAGTILRKPADQHPDEYGIGFSRSISARNSCSLARSGETWSSAVRAR